jgi:hypothetical protein
MLLDGVVDSVDFSRVVAEFGAGAALLIEPGSTAAAHVPARWSAVASGVDPATRRAAAVALWNFDMAELTPRFTAVLDECLDDVRVCLLRGDWVLLYALRPPFGAHEFRIGWDPESFGADEPPYWQLLPEALRVFLRTVHAGFTDLDGISYGPARPRDMLTYREADIEPSVRDWDAAVDIPAERVVLIAKGLGGTRYFVSPDLPDGCIGWEAGGNMKQPLDFARTFDDLISHGFRLRRDAPPETAAPQPGSAQAQPVARAVVWHRELTEDAARERLRELVADVLDTAGGQLRVRPRDGLDGELVLPCDDGAGNVYQIDRLEVRYFLDPPPPDRAAVYVPLIVRAWERHGWKVTHSGDAHGILAQARTKDWYELTVSHDDQTVRLTATSPGFHRPPWRH